jgi:hypothetical protein
VYVCGVHRVVALTAAGSELCYWGSRRYAGALLLSYLPDRLSVLRPLVQRTKSQGGATVPPLTHTGARAPLCYRTALRSLLVALAHIL